MKRGQTAIVRSSIAGFPPTVEVGDDDRAVYVSFGSVTFLLSNRGRADVVIVRAEASDDRGNVVRVMSYGVSDVQNQYEFHVGSPAEEPAR